MFSSVLLGGGGVQICGGGVISASGFGPGCLNPLGRRNGGMTEWWNGRELRKILNTERRKITQVLRDEAAEKLPEILKDRTAETTPNPKKNLRFFSS